MSTIPCPLFVRSQQAPQEEALVWGRRTITWDQLNAYVQSTARYLKEVRIRPGTRVATFSRNSVEYVITLLALWRVGACVMPLSVHLAPSVLKDVLKHFDPRCLFFADPLTFHPVGIKTYSLTMLVSYEFTDGFLGREANICPEVELRTDAAVVLTTGSSGMPKGVLLSYGNLYANALGANDLIPFFPGDRWLLSLPLWHVSGLSIIFRALAGGGTVVVPEADEPPNTAITRYRPTHLSLVPAQLKRLMEEDGEKVIPGIKAVLLGGAPIPSSLAKEAALAGFPLYATYGLTETASQVATGRIGKDGNIVVRSLKDREVMISPDGEVLVRGPVVFKRYLFGGNEDAFDADGWFHTGDAGEMDVEGRLRITGRRDNMFICGGENVYPEAIEKALLEHPDIEQAVVVGIEDETLGKRPVAFVRFRGSAVVLSDALADFLKGRLARHEIPKTFYVWPELGEAIGLKPGRKMFAELIVHGRAERF